MKCWGKGYRQNQGDFERRHTKLDDEGWMGIRDEWNDRGCGISRGEASTLSTLSHKSTNPIHKGSAS